jgi:hypothetical protein
MTQFRPLPARSGEVRGQTQRLRVGHQRNSSTDQGHSYRDAVRPGHRRLHRVRDCRRGVIPMYAQAFRPDVFWNTSAVRGRQVFC